MAALVKILDRDRAADMAPATIENLDPELFRPVDMKAAPDGRKAQADMKAARGVRRVEQADMKVARGVRKVERADMKAAQDALKAQVDMKVVRDVLKAAVNLPVVQEVQKAVDMKVARDAPKAAQVDTKVVQDVLKALALAIEAASEAAAKEARRVLIPELLV
jgi:hypothetical protein